MSESINSADIRQLAVLIKDNWTLCEFLGNSEMEYMVAETIHAARLNLAEHGEPFSFRGDNVFSNYGNGLVNNANAYQRLLDDGLFREERRHGRPVIFPTSKLTDKLKRFLKIDTSTENTENANHKHSPCRQ